MLGFGVIPSCLAQQDNTQELLERIRTSLSNYSKTLPNLVCKEQLTSKRIVKGKVKDAIMIESELIAERPTADDNQSNFHESRKFQTVNGKPYQTGRKVAIPFMVNNGFGSTLQAYFSKTFEPYNDYKILQSNAQEITLEISLKAEAHNLSACQSPRETSKVTRIRFTAKQLELIDVEQVSAEPGRKDGYSDFRARLQYAPVAFGEREYRIPFTVNGTLTRSGKDDQLTYATAYSGCHKFGASARLLPGGTAE